MSTSLIVEVEQGKLRGKEKRSVLTGNVYYSFQGIPYAEKPLGKLRFQDPIPLEKWDGIYEATYDRDICIQEISESEIVGSEDCLYLTVNTPQIPNEIKELKPVMVRFHGGAFTTGSGAENTSSADYLIGHDVIIVTLNYRLHVLGFLNLGIPECPGNAGLKDQLVALKWVNRNISKFGGDPDNVTLFGESAGGVSSQMHTISPLSKGLFKRVITQSGSVLSFRALICNPDEVAMKFARKLGFNGNDEDKEDILNFLRQLDATDLLKEVLNSRKFLRDRYPFGCQDITFAPSVEVIPDGAFLPDYPENLLKIAKPVPIMTGANSRDGMFIFILSPTEQFAMLDEKFELVLRNTFEELPESEIPQMAKDIKKYYFGNKKPDLEAANEISMMYTDLMMYNIYEAIEYVVNSPFPAYVYEFDYNGGLNMMKPKAEKKIGRTMEGACHADEVDYLFYPKKDSEIPNIENADREVINEITTLWTNFAKNGVPSTDLKWKPTTKKESSFLRISNGSKVINGKIFGDGLQFLKNILKEGKQSTRVYF